MIKIVQGNALTVLKSLKDNCIQTCVTSPPYWGLRNYGGEAQIWGGVESCAHDFVEHRWYTENSAAKSNGCAEAFSKAGEQNAQRLKDARWRTDATCNICGAWRGALGLESTPLAFVEHIVEIFREVRRILRPDGTLWLNLGDSYVGGGRGGGGKFAAERPGWNDVPMEFGKKRGTPGLKHKDLCGIPWRVAFALQQDGWYLRQDIIWAKPNPMPESVRDRCTKSHEYLFMLSKAPKYYFDSDAISEPTTESTKARLSQPTLAQQHGSERVPGKTNGAMKAVGRSARNSFKRANSKRAEVFPGQSVGTHRPDRREDTWDIAKRNRRSVWTITTKPFKEAHFATFPPDLVEPCILAGSPESSVVLDPFAGSGTVGMVANKLNRHAILIELNADYVQMAERRCGLTPSVPSATLQPAQASP
jgi:DNA modification methylase